MQNKGFVKVIAVLLTLICCFYLSFSFVTNKYEKNADTYAAAKIKGGKYADDNAKDRAFNDFRTAYLDSMGNEKVYMWKTIHIYHMHCGYLVMIILQISQVLWKVASMYKILVLC